MVLAAFGAWPIKAAPDLKEEVYDIQQSSNSYVRKNSKAAQRILKKGMKAVR